MISCKKSKQEVTEGQSQKEKEHNLRTLRGNQSAAATTIATKHGRQKKRIYANIVQETF